MSADLYSGPPPTPEELHLRGLCLDALTVLKSAHEELLRGRYQQAGTMFEKAEFLAAECRRLTEARL